MALILTHSSEYIAEKRLFSRLQEDFILFFIKVHVSESYIITELIIVLHTNLRCLVTNEEILKISSFISMLFVEEDNATLKA